MTTLSKTLTGFSTLLSRFYAISPAKSLTQAIHRRQITPVYQPIIDARTGYIAGIEVLARWRHPLFGPISPETFIPLAEKNNLIAPLTHQLIQQVIADLRPQIHLFPSGLYICLNLSAFNCLDRHFEADTAELLHQFAASNIQVVVEITENHPLHVTPRLSEWFATLRESNIAIALDDFGTGYSNIAYIDSLQPEFIKIDKMFVGEIREKGDTRLLDGLIGLAKTMQLKIVAEGVETQAQADYLSAKEVDFMQGYLFCRPLPADELMGWMAGHVHYRPRHASAL